MAAADINEEELLELVLAEDFIDLMSVEETKELARLLITLQKYNALKSLVVQECLDCQTAFSQWVNDLELENNKEILEAIPSISRTKITIYDVLNSINSEQKKHLLCFLIKHNQWKTCEKILATQSEATKQIFEAWKSDACGKMIDLVDATTNVEDGDDDGLEPYDQVSPTLFQNFDKETNILILGETGVGKTTMINALGNYLCSSTVFEAQEKPIFLARAQMTHMNDDLTIREIICESTLNIMESQRNNERNTFNGNSVTKKPMIYKFAVGPPRSQKIIRLIDTPGVVDAGGSTEDRKNFANIMKAIVKHTEIKAIMILMNCDDQSMTTHFKYCLDELFTFFPAYAKKNIIFCFTKSRVANYELGGSYFLLNEYIQNKKRKNKGMDIKLNKSNLFTFENDCFNYICKTIHGVVFTEEEKDIFNKSWRFSARETFRMFETIVNFKPIKTVESVSIYILGQSLTVLTKHLVKATKNYNKVAQQLEAKMCERVDFRQNQARVPKYYYEYEQETIELNVPRIVCNSPNCPHLDKKSTETERGKQVVETKFVCHNNFHTSSYAAMPEMDPVRQCHIFSMNGICRKCDCSWENHSRDTSEIRWKLVKKENSLYQSRISDNEQKEKQFLAETVNLREKRDQFIRKKEQLQTLCTNIAMFLKATRVISFNTEMINYLNDEIAIAKDKKDTELENELTAKLEAYEATAKIFEEVGGVESRNIKTLQEIDNDIMKSKKDFPEVVPEIIEIESIKEGNSDNQLEVPMHNTRFSKTFNV